MVGASADAAWEGDKTRERNKFDGGSKKAV